MKNKILWWLQILLAIAFLAAGAGKLAGGQQVVEFFDKIGLGQWSAILRLHVRYTVQFCF